MMEGSTVVGHLPRAISAVCSLLLSRNGTISCKVTSTRRQSSDLPQGGLEIPCKLILVGASRDISKVQKLITGAQSSGLEMTCKKDDDAEPEKKEGKRSRKEQPEKKQAEIDVPNFSEERWRQLNNCLSQVNKRELCDGKRLSDLHINYAQALLQKQFPELGKLHCSLLQEKSKCKISQGLQIVHSRGDHWIVASTLDHDSSDVDDVLSIFESSFLNQFMNKWIRAHR